MAQRRKPGLITHLVSIAAASAAVLALVGMLPPATQRGMVVTAKAEPIAAGSASSRPSYIVRDAPPVVVPPAEPAPVRASLSVQPVAVVEAPRPAAEKWYVTAGALNVRAGPSSGSQLLAALPMGTAVEVSGTQGKWTEILTADGLKGWVFTKYLSRAAPR
ncbi:MAG: SH3 domain-containing protein [Devosia sp.]